MNIFVLSEDPVEAAIMQCDKHVVKMCLESVQLLCSAFKGSRVEDEIPYKITHYNHPCAKWVRESIPNFEWMLKHTSALFKEYTFRYDKWHKSEKVFEWCCRNEIAIDFNLNEETPFSICVSEETHYPNNPVKSYRKYYLKDKAHMAEWNKRRKAPDWFDLPPF